MSEANRGVLGKDTGNAQDAPLVAVCRVTHRFGRRTVLQGRLLYAVSW